MSVIRIASAERLPTWHRELDGPALAARLKTLRRILDPVDGELPAAGTPVAAARTEVLALLDDLLAARHALADQPH
ncbi:hypothetical protein [Streptomyces sp. NPDC053813]|uniref:hypothetical protein n=1 Tax=Streptomyces sp. NPDC053813 TaxID=3365717 RepID=UPI0037D222DE